MFIFAPILSSLLIFSVPASAVTLWLETSPEDLKENALIEFNAGFADDFDLVELGPNNIANIVFPVILGKSGETPTIKEVAPSYAFVTKGAAPPGSYVVYSSYKPWISGQVGRPKNKYVLTAAHVFNIGSAADDLVTKPTGKIPLEIVPSTNPLQIKAGDRVSLRVLLNGAPLPRAVVLGEPKGYNPKGSKLHARAFYSPTDDQGKFEFTPLKGGLWFLSVRHSVPNEDKKESDDVVYLHNFTLHVGEASSDPATAAHPASGTKASSAKEDPAFPSPDPAAPKSPAPAAK
ncbi:MAG: DUF4198 domain-containing protein [Deltaproteobacteria bacterium]|nr:DUF4198 domain-containing protein [Deltaproteobacteria bacterium]